MPSLTRHTRWFWVLAHAVFWCVAFSAEGASAAEKQVSFVNDVVPVLTKAGCNAGACHAKAGGGQAFDIRQGNDEILNVLKSQLDRLEKTEREAEAAGELESWFQWFLAVALILLAVDFLVKWAK